MDDVVEVMQVVSRLRQAVDRRSELTAEDASFWFFSILKAMGYRVSRPARGSLADPWCVRFEEDS